MKKISFLFVLSILIFSTLTTNAFAALNPTVYDYGYFGVDYNNTTSKILWAEYPYNNYQWNSVQIDSDGRYLVRIFDQKGKIVLQNIQENNQQLDLTPYDAYGIQIQLSKTKGTYARLVEARSDNPLAQTVYFLDNEEF